LIRVRKFPVTGEQMRKKNPFYNSWISLTVFVALIIFTPYKISFLSFKVSDFWLGLCLVLQHINGFNRKLDVRNRGFLKNFGLWMGLIALAGTVFQALQDDTPLNPIFLSEFYRFFRYFLIFKFVENIVARSSDRDLIKYLSFYTVLGAITIVFAFLEFYSAGVFQKMILNFYYVVPDQTFDEYIKEFGRLLGVMGNSNTTAIYLTSTIVFPVFSLVIRRTHMLNKLLFVLYVLLALYVVIFLTSSRTSIVISMFLLVFLIVLSFSQVRIFFRFLFVMTLSVAVGMYFFIQYNSDVVVADRVAYFFEGRSTQGEKVGLIESMGRNELWKSRYTTFVNHAHPFAILTGMGYTKVYEDYSDNGMLSAFFNGGLLSLSLRLILYFITIRYGLLAAFSRYWRANNQTLGLILATVSIVFLSWEFTADCIEHVKIGQIFYLFFSATFIIAYKQKKLAPADSRVRANTFTVNKLINNPG
jgi:hypothetical protein